MPNQTRVYPVLDLLAGLAREHGRRLQMRPVRSADRDSEIRVVQARGPARYPVFTRQINTAEGRGHAQLQGSSNSSTSAASSPLIRTSGTSLNATPSPGPNGTSLISTRPRAT